MVKVCVIGLGTIGNPVMYHISSYYDVCGYDIDLSKVKTENYYTTANWENIRDIDIFVVCVSTWWKEKPDMSAVREVMEKIKEKSTRETLVTIESTVSVGTCRKLFKEVFDGRILLSCCPHRYWGEDSENYGVVQERVLGAIDKESLEKSMIFYRSIKIPVHVVSPVEVAEVSKLVENAYRFVQIAFVEELKNICEENSLSFEEVRIACNTKWNIDLLEARDGIGEGCLPKDIRILNFSVSSTPLLQGAIEADMQYKRRLKGL